VRASAAPSARAFCSHSDIRCACFAALEFETTPDYDGLRRMLVSGILDAAPFDWEVSAVAPLASSTRPSWLTLVLLQTPSGPSPRPAVVAPASAGGAALPWYASDPSRSTPAAPAAPPPADGDNGQAKRARLEPSSRALAEEMLQKRPSLEGCVMRPVTRRTSS